MVRLKIWCDLPMMFLPDGQILWECDVTLTGILQSDPPDINRVPMIAVEVVSSGKAIIL